MQSRFYKHMSIELDFGKFRGQTIEDVPLSYVVFLAGYKMLGSRRVQSNHKSFDWILTHKKDFHEHAKQYLDGKCWHCGGKIVPVGNKRFNGACHEDWDGRYLHKKCWKELRDEDLDDF